MSTARWRTDSAACRLVSPPPRTSATTITTTATPTTMPPRRSDRRTGRLAGGGGGAAGPARTVVIDRVPSPLPQVPPTARRPLTPPQGSHSYGPANTPDRLSGAPGQLVGIQDVDAAPGDSNRSGLFARFQPLVGCRACRTRQLGQVLLRQRNRHRFRRPVAVQREQIAQSAQHTLLYGDVQSLEQGVGQAPALGDETFHEQAVNAGVVASQLLELLSMNGHRLHRFESDGACVAGSRRDQRHLAEVVTGTE